VRAACAYRCDNVAIFIFDHLKSAEWTLGEPPASEEKKEAKERQELVIITHPTGEAS
jgi:hypothetical protein